MLGLKPEKDASLILAIKEAVKKLGLFYYKFQILQKQPNKLI